MKTIKLKSVHDQPVEIAKSNYTLHNTSLHLVHHLLWHSSNGTTCCIRHVLVRVGSFALATDFNVDVVYRPFLYRHTQRKWESLKSILLKAQRKVFSHV